MNSLRKVRYHLDDGYRQFDPDSTGENEHDRERMGWFHKWTSYPELNPRTGEEFVTDYALVEDCQTGEMKTLPPRLVVFADREP